MHRLTPTLLAAASLALAAPAGAAAAPAPLPTPAPVAGSGDQPNLALQSSSAAGPDGSTAIAGARSDDDHYTPVVGFGTAGAAPASFTPLAGQTVMTTYPRVALGASGQAAVTWADSRVAYLALCQHGTCAKPIRVGSSRLKPEPTVAVDPSTGRTLVLFRGYVGSKNLLQWRITTNGKLGKIHTLSEFGDDPTLGTDASGKSYALWNGTGGLRSSGRRVGEFTTPRTLDTNGHAPSLTVSPDGEALAAWISSPSYDVESPVGQVEVASRTANTNFGAPQLVGAADSATVDLARNPAGYALLAIDTQVPGTSEVVPGASVRAPGGQFNAPTPVAGATFISDAFPAQAAIDAAGTMTVAWAGGQTAGAPDAGVFAARADTSGVFGAPQQLDTDPGDGQRGGVQLAGGASTLLSSTGAGGPVATAGG